MTTEYMETEQIIGELVNGNMSELAALILVLSHRLEYGDEMPDEPSTPEVEVEGALSSSSPVLGVDPGRPDDEMATGTIELTQVQGKPKLGLADVAKDVKPGQTFTLVDSEV